jgi:hypothetical protein
MRLPLRFRQLAICTVTLVGVFALAHDSWDVIAAAKTENGPTQSSVKRLEPARSTAFALDSFQATRLPDGRTDVEWRIRAADRLVFRLYRELDGHRVSISPSLTSDPMVSSNGYSKASAQAGQLYTWWDRAAPRDGEVSYWLEDVNVKGQSRWHGPLVLVARDRRP